MSSSAIMSSSSSSSSAATISVRRSSQRAEPQVEDRLRLDFREVELPHQSRTRRVGVRRGANEGNHGVEVVERDQVAAQDVRALLGLPKLVLRTAGDDLALETQVLAEQLEQRQRPPHTVDERDRVVA